MAGFLAQFVDPSDLTPHGFCLAWDPGLIWLHAVSDSIIALAYFSIPLAMAAFGRRRTDLSFSWVLWLFAAFIAACGTTHVFGALTLWVPAYWPDGIVKAITAALSLITAALLWPLIPRALALPSPATLQRTNTALQQQASAREAAVRQLVDNERRYRAFFNEAPVAMHSLDAGSRIVAVSDQWLGMLGYKREDVLGKPVTAFQSPESADEPPAERGATRGAKRDLERCFVRKNGEIVDVVLSSSIQADAVDGTWRSICVLTDVTARKRTEAALAASEQRLRQAEKMSALGQLAGGVAHDFNNVLQAVQGGAALIERGVGQSESLRRLARSIIVATERGASITRRLLVFARHGELRSTPVDPQALLNGLAELFAHTLGGGIHVVVDAAPNLPPLMADKDQLETVLINLATNARDAMSGSGRLILSADEVSVGETTNHPAGLTPGSYIHLSVGDSGIGMAPETLARAAEPFFTTKPAGRGTGLGLSMAQGFADQSGGALVIQSTLDKGTVVSIWLPLATAPAPGALNEAPAAPIRLPEDANAQVTIMLVDDEEIVRTPIAVALEAAGFAIIDVGSGAEALEMIEAGRTVNVLISDLSMPGLDGLSLIGEAQRRRPGLPAILLTGFATHVAEMAASHSTNASFTVVRKPVTGEQLSDQVAVMLESVRMRHRLTTGV